MSQKKVVVLGAGKVGQLVSWFLADSGDYHVTAVDLSEENAKAAVTLADGSALPNSAHAVANLSDEQAVAGVVDGADYVLSCAPYHCNVGIAKAAKSKGAHYLDLTEDVATTKTVAKLAENSDLAFIPQCGLAPGFITIAAHGVAQHFDSLDTIKMRVGALPLYPHNRLNYNLTWNTEGLINEYRHPCEAVRDGKFVVLPPLEDLEVITLDGVEYEAFNTSGGLGSMAETYAGRIRSLDYKSMRYPGHRDVLKILMEDLRLHENPDLMKDLFEHALPHTRQDVVIIVVTVTGSKGNRHAQESYVNKVFHSELGGQRWGAIQITTAAGICAVLDLHAQGQTPQAGFVRQEDVDLRAFLDNRFGRHYGQADSAY